MKSYLQTYPFIKALVLGISGGQDSTLTGKLCQQAINELRAEGDDSRQFIAVRLPYGVQADEQDCQDAIAFIQPDRVLTVNIKGAVLASEQALREAGIELSDFVRGNEKARERMKAQYSIAGMTHGVVVGTDHAAEAITGFFTKYGDGGTDINPIFRLNKRQGKQLLARLAARSICTRSCRPPIWKTIARPCRMKPRWASPTIILTTIWKAKPSTRRRPKLSKAGT